MIHTELCDLLGIEYPVFQGGMAWIADGKLAAAVSNGGGLGVVAAGNAPADYVRQQIRIAKSLTDKPFGVNIMLMSPFADEVAQVAAEERVAVVTTGAGNPSKYMQLWKDAGIKVIPVVASVAMAKLMTRLGASAGGIADGCGFAAAMMLSDCGVQMGTHFLSAEEGSIHPTYKEKIVKAGDLATMVTGKRLGHPVRSLRTAFARNYSKAEYSAMPDDELEQLGVGALRKAVQDGNLEEGCFLSGQIAAMVTKVEPAADIVRSVVEEAEPILRGAAKWVK